MPERILILTGTIQSGKTGKLLEWSRERDDVFGILTPVIDSKRVFMDAHSREQFPMEAEGLEASIDVGRFHFSKKNFEKAISVLQQNIDAPGWLVIDEIGPLELRGEGFAVIARKIISERRGEMLFVVRNILLGEVIVHFGLESYSTDVINVDDQLPGPLSQPESGGA